MRSPNSRTTRHPPRTLNSVTSANSTSYLRALRVRARAAIPLAIVLVVLCNVPVVQFPGWTYVAATLGAVVALWGATPFYRGMFSTSTPQDTLSDTLVSLGVLVATSWSAVVLAYHPSLTVTQSFSPVPLLSGEGPVLLFDAAAALTAAALWPKYKEHAFRRRLAETWKNIAAVSIAEATLVKRRDLRRVRATELSFGDVIEVQPGERFPTDGLIAQGESAMDASFLLGPRDPITLTPGTEVLAGAINLDGEVRVHVTHAVKHSTLRAVQSQLHEESLEFAGGPAEEQNRSRMAVLLAICAAVAAAGLMMLLGRAPGAGVAAAVAVLAAVSPTSPGSAAPLPLVLALHDAARHGVYFANRYVMEWVTKASAIAFVRTSVLTKGVHSMVSVHTADGWDGDANLAVSYAASLEDTVAHPIAHAIVAEARKRKVTVPAAEGFVHDPGVGVRGNIMGHRIRLATSGAFNEASVPADLLDYVKDAAGAGLNTMYLDVAGEIVAVFITSDPLRQTATTAMDELTDAGFAPFALTGGDARQAKYQENKLAIPFKAGLSPTDRLLEIASSEEGGSYTAVVGMRRRDADLLRTGSVSVAVGPSTGMGEHRSDISILSSNLTFVPYALRLASRTAATLATNNNRVRAYNIVAALLAAVGLIHPVLAATAIAVVASTLLRSTKPTES